MTDLHVIALDEAINRAVANTAQILRALDDILDGVNTERAVMVVADLARENAATIAALSAALQAAINAPSSGVAYRDLIERAADANRITPDEADKLLTLLTFSDEQLAEYDLTTDVIYAAEIRDKLIGYLNDINNVID